MNQVTERDHACFNRAVELYRRHRHYFYSFLRPIEVVLFSRVQDRFNPPVADFGCGDGFFAGVLAPPGAFEYGIDTDPVALESARAVYQSVIQNRGSVIDLPSGSIATIISNSVLEHLLEPARTLQELNRILRPGGRLFASITLKNWEDCLCGACVFGNLYKRFFRTIQRHHALHDIPAWSEWFSEAGFRISSITGYLDPQTVRTIEIFHYLGLPTLAAEKLPTSAGTAAIRTVNNLYNFLHPPSAEMSIITGDNLSRVAYLEPVYDSEQQKPIGTTRPCCFIELEKQADK
ncbi:methyltransferase domain-containing protein [bacterium]|nr:methyltransferase domain-containing protein [candidate division CSSED10-310 bacterium]